MSISRFLTYCALGGGFVPLFIRAVWAIVNKYQAANLTLQAIIEKLMLMLWPSSIMTLPGEGDQRLGVMLLMPSIAANILLYVSVGAVVWYGIKKNRFVLLLLAIVIVAIWWRVLTL